MELKVIARIRNDFPEKFGLPRQSGLVESVTGRIVFEKAYRDKNALRGLEEFSHLWLIWGFSRSEWKTEWSPTVRPPRLGGNKRMGVFATRAPYRPNPIALSCVKIARIDMDTPEGPVIHVLGADLMDGTPIYDIKPYLPYSDSHPDAVGGFGEKVLGDTLDVVIPEKLLALIPEDKRQALTDILKGDPRPHYHEDNRLYGVRFAAFNVRFTVKENVLTVVEVTENTNTDLKEQ
ncbi:MAG: tRNA (N6-threonylcarbamoyladenosine(37)-N6)-methyltransferase TrmO [Clostridia bacterium]|nr:tRNA (N6-threonylcarbamoyladenosine(37)-N6)-methyltransferase TrmO [Clostridia bacterium]